MALTYQAAVEQTIIAGEQIHQIVNGTATTEITVEDGSKIPSVRKFLVDNFYFKDPIAWQVGQTENVFNQLRQFTDGSWWYAPSATASNPISMGSTPVGDPLWKIYTIDAVGKLAPQIREALRRSYAEAGYNLVSGSFEDGGVLTLANDALIQESTGKAYSGTIGTVAAGTNPLGGGFVDRSIELLSLNLNKQEGSSKVGFHQAGSGSVPRTSQDKMREWVSVKDKGADPSGLTDSTASFVSAGYFAFVPPGTYLVDPAQVNINQYWGPGRLRYTTDSSEHWCGLVSKGTLYIRNDDRNPDTTPTVPADGLINLADGELKFLCDLDGDGDYDADVYGKNNLYIAGENSIHFRIDPQGPAEGRIRLASTANTNFIQSGKDFSGATIKNLAFGPYLSTDYWAFFSQASGYCVIGNSASPAAPLHIFNQQTTAALAENTSSSRARMGFKGSTTTSGTSVTFGANGDDAEIRAGGVERLVITSSGVVRPGADNTQNLGSGAFRFSTVFAGTGTINTSDANEKTSPQKITDAMLDAADDISIAVWKWLASIREKGEDAARWHFGPIAQQVRDAFAAHGLDGCDYGLLCYDKWGDQYEDEIDGDGNPTGATKLTVAAGERWGLRPDQCLWLLAAAARRKSDRMQQQLINIEDRLTKAGL